MENEIILKLEELLIQSESRMDRVNDIICKCVDLMNKLTSEYTTQLEKLQAARDDALLQNNNLINSVNKAMEALELSNKRYDLLLEKSFGLINNNRSENNINLK